MENTKQPYQKGDGEHNTVDVLLSPKLQKLPDELIGEILNEYENYRQELSPGLFGSFFYVRMEEQMEKCVVISDNGGDRLIVTSVSELQPPHSNEVH